jgi:very-short-patch-repair endonuclease
MKGRELYRLDFAWPEPMVAVEYDGYAAHVDRLVRDAERDEDLRRRGWLVLHADAADLSDPSRLHVEVRQAFWRRRFAA